MTNAPDPQQHATALFALLDSEWPGSGDEARNGRVLHSHYDWQASRIGMLGDQLVTHYGVYDIQMRIGMASLRTAGVNLVVTQPQQRGRGLMTATAQASLAAMHTAGYDLSLVCNATEGFYGRLGYLFAWPEHDFLIDVAHLPSEASDVALVAVQPSQRADFAALYNRDHAQITGTAVRRTFARGKHPGNGRGVCWHDQQGNTQGYLFFDIHAPSATLWHDDSAGDVAQRLQVLGMLARQFDCAQVRFERLPYRGPLGRRLRQMTSRIEARYSQSGGWMAQIINMQSLVAQLAPELERRLHTAGLAGWNGDLLIQSDREQLTLRIANGHVQPTPHGDTQHMIAAGAALARLVVGSAASDEIAVDTDMPLRGAGALLLRALFPAQNPTMAGDDL